MRYLHATDSQLNLLSWCADVIDMKGYDIFGNTQQSLQKNVDCPCPNCDRTLGAAKFAPHLEKCMGMGRNSTRLANRK